MFISSKFPFCLIFLYNVCSEKLYEKQVQIILQRYTNFDQPDNIK